MRKVIVSILFLCCIVFLNINANGQNIKTFAGNGMPGFSGDGGPATTASLGVPQAVAVDNSGNVFIVDISECVVRKVDVHGIITTVAGNDTPGYSGDNGPAVAAQLHNPSAIAIDAEGNLYIADDGNYAVRKVSASGIITTIAGTGVYGYSGDGAAAATAQLRGAAGLALDAAGNLYVADGISSVRKITGTGIISTYAGSVTTGYSGDHGPAIAALLNTPTGLATDDTGNLYIADNENNVIRKVDTFHTITTVAGNGDYAGMGYGGYNGDSMAATSAELNLPNGICVDKQAGLLIADVSNSIIRYVNNEGIIYTIAGQPGMTGYSGDGFPASSSFLNNPSGVAIDGNENLYIADADNNAVRKVDAIDIYATPGDTVCYRSPVTFFAGSLYPDTGISYQWKKNGINVGTDSADYITDTIQNRDIITCTLSFGNPATVISNSDSITMIWKGLPPAVTVSSSSPDTICAATTVTFTATEDPLLVYKWLKNGVVSGYGFSYSYAPANGDQIVCAVSNATVCGTSMPFAITVNANATPEVFINSIEGLYICPSSLSVFTAIGYFGGTDPVYKWEVNGDSITTGDSTAFTYTPASGDVITCTLTSDYRCRLSDTAISNPLDITLLPLVTPSVTITMNAPDTICAGTTVTLTATITNGGDTPAIQWFKNGIATVTDSSYILVPADGDDIRCLISSSACASPDTVGSNHIIIPVLPIVVPGITIATTTDSVCSGTMVIFTVADTNAGSSPVFTWKVNGVNTGHGTSYSCIPSNSDIIKCQMTSNAACQSTNSAVSENIIMYVDSIMLSPSATISALAGDTVCAGISVTYTANAVNGGAASAYQWKVNGIPVPGSTNATYTYAPLSEDNISCTIISNAHCLAVDTATSDSITMWTLPVFTPSVSITEMPGISVCAGSAVTYTATANGAGTSPLYLWRINGYNVSTTPIYSYTPADGDIVTCIITSNAHCTTADTVSGTIDMTVNPVVTPAVSISTGSEGSVCAGMATTYSATTTNGGPSPAFRWLVNGISATTGSTGSNYTYMPANGDTVSCILTGSDACATADTAVSGIIVMTVNPSFVPSISVTAMPGTTVCAGTSVTYTAAAANGGPSPQYQWKINGADAATGSSYTYTPANGNIITCVLTSNAVCAIPDTAVSAETDMVVNNEVTPSVMISANPGTMITATGQTITFTATVINGGTAPTYQWYINNIAIPGATAPTLVVDTFSANDSVYCMITSNAPCATTTAAASNTENITISLSVSQLSATTQNITLEPNPNNGSFTIKGNTGNSINEPLTIEITDLLGQVIYQQAGIILQGKIDTQIMLNSTCANGIYLLTIHSGTIRSIIRFVIEK